MPTGSPDGSSPASTPLPSLPASRNTSRAASPTMPRLAVLEHGRPTTSARFFCKAVENPNVNFESQR